MWIKLTDASFSGGSFFRLSDTGLTLGVSPTGNFESFQWWHMAVRFLAANQQLVLMVNGVAGSAGTVNGNVQYSSNSGVNNAIVCEQFGCLVDFVKLYSSGDLSVTAAAATYNSNAVFSAGRSDITAALDFEDPQRIDSRAATATTLAAAVSDSGVRLHRMCGVRQNYSLRVSNGAPNVDGLATEPAWAATPIDTFSMLHIAPAVVSIRLLHDDTWLYVFYNVSDTTPAPASSNAFIAGDSAELYAAAQHFGGNVEFGVRNATGTITTQSQGSRSSSGWLLEMALPLASVGRGGAGVQNSIPALFACNDRPSSAGSYRQFDNSGIRLVPPGSYVTGVAAWSTIQFLETPREFTMPPTTTTTITTTTTTTTMKMTTTATTPTTATPTTPLQPTVQTSDNARQTTSAPTMGNYSVDTRTTAAASAQPTTSFRSTSSLASASSAASTFPSASLLSSSPALLTTSPSVASTSTARLASSSAFVGSLLFIAIVAGAGACCLLLLCVLLCVLLRRRRQRHDSYQDDTDSQTELSVAPGESYFSTPNDIYASAQLAAAAGGDVVYSTFDAADDADAAAPEYTRFEQQGIVYDAAV